MRATYCGAIAAIVIGLLAGCASVPYQPVVDRASITDQAKYDIDLEECQQYARAHDPARGALLGLIGGALLGAAIGTAIGDSSAWASAGAKSGAIGGAMGGATGEAQTQQQVVQRCLSGRGYSVLE